MALLADIGYQIPGYQAQGSTPPIATESAETIFGTILGDAIDGLGGNDQIQGDRGNDQLTGGAGRDTFAFRAESGADRINDFVVADDIIQIAVGLGFSTGADVLGAISGVGNSTSGGVFSDITLSSGNTIRVFSNVALTAANFTIAGPTTL